MCVAVPAKVIKVEEPWAQVDLEGTTFKINMMLTPEVKEGDYVFDSRRFFYSTFNS